MYGLKFAFMDEHFWSNVDVRIDEECWTWTASLDRDGYGRYRRSRRLFGAHKFAYEERFGPVPKGLTLDHLCRNRACVNPAHLEPVTNAENVRRGCEHRLSTDLLNEIARRHVEGWTLVDLGREYGFSSNGLKLRLQNAGVYVARGSGRRASPR